jgi:hypothetical protein
MNQQNVLWGSFIAAALVVGCSGSIDVGPGGGGAGPTGATAGASGQLSDGGGASANDGLATPWPAAACTRDTPLPTWPNASDCTADSSLTIAGTWHGTVDNATAPFDGATLVISGRDANGHVCGTYTAGTAAAPPPVSNPNVGYPTPDSYGDVNAQPVDGAPLSLLKASLVGSRLSFYYAVAEARRGWCQKQRSYDAPLGSGTCRCLPPWEAFKNGPTDCALIDPNGGNHTVSCGQQSHCTGLYCACNSTGCDATQDTTLVDLTFDGDNAVGSVAGGRVVFTRAK